MKKFSIVAITIFMALSLTGCLRVVAEELYSLPQVSEEYLRLQAQINLVLDQGAEFSPPTGGLNRQAVQLKDINGNGTNEVISFFATPSESMLKIYIFARVENDYTVAEIIEGSGTAIESVRYEDMDGDGVLEIIVGWQMSPALKLFSIYSIRDFHSVLLAEREYNVLTVFDMDGDGNEDVVALRLPTQDTGAAADLFTLMPDGEIVGAAAWLSNGIESITRVLTGKLSDGVPAIFVESEGKFDGGGQLTDILALQDGVFSNISLKASGGVSEETVRARNLASDITKDGCVEIPIPRLLKAQSDTAYYAIDWYDFSSSGDSKLALTTYHNNFDEWYLILPFDWRGKVSVRREDIISGERTVIFSYITEEDESYEDFLKVFRLTGDIGEERANLPGRNVLMSEGASTYAFELLAPPNSFGLTFDEALIWNNFRLIYSDWLAGTS